HLRQIAALNLGGIAFRPVQLAAFGPESKTLSRRGAPGPAFALVGGGAADGLDEQSFYSALGVKAGDARLAAVDDMPDAIDGDRSFGDIRRHDHFSKRARGKRPVLFLPRQFAVQRQ